MKKTDLIDVIKENVGISKKDAEKALTVSSARETQEPA